MRYGDVALGVECAMPCLATHRTRQGLWARLARWVARRLGSLG